MARLQWDGAASVDTSIGQLRKLRCNYRGSHSSGGLQGATIRVRVCEAAEGDVSACASGAARGGCRLHHPPHPQPQQRGMSFISGYMEIPIADIFLRQHPADR